MSNKASWIVCRYIRAKLFFSWLIVSFCLVIIELNTTKSHLLAYTLNQLTISSPILIAQTPRESQCPHDLEILSELLLQDLPSYANRVIQRARNIESNWGTVSYVIVAGKPEFEPLSLNLPEQPDPILSPGASAVKQLFFTTLERRYTANQVWEVQHYHWLFLTPTEEGWRIVILFSRFGSPSKRVPPTPPQETSNGVVGQAIRLWLRDCRAGAIGNLAR